MTSRFARWLVLAAGLVGPGGGAAGRPRQDDRRPARSRALQGDDQGADGVRRSPRGHDRNRAAIDWIEAQLKSYGCPTERLRYDFKPRPPAAAPAPGGRPCIPQRNLRPAARRRTIPGESATRPASTPIRRGSPTKSFARSTRSRRAAPARASRCTARRSAPRGPTRCTSSARTWTATAGARRPTTTAPARAIVMELARILNSPDVSNGSHDPLHPVEQRGDRPERQRRLRGAAEGSARPGGAARLTPLPRTALARRHPARHDALRSRHAARRRHTEPRAAARSRRERRVPGELEDGGAVAGARVGAAGGQREVTRPTTRRRSAAT